MLSLMPEYIGAIDQGTTSTRFIVFDRAGRLVTTAQKEHQQIYPRPGWVEHDPLEIWSSQLSSARRVMSEHGAAAGDLAGVGITNQRETTLLWRRSDGRPVYPAIVWQDRRTSARCEQLRGDGRAAPAPAKGPPTRASARAAPRALRSSAAVSSNPAAVCASVAAASVAGGAAARSDGMERTGAGAG